MADKPLQFESVPSHTFTFAEKVSGVLVSLRQRLRPRPVLIAGPFAGEFGYELMLWQGYIRARIRHYDAVHVLTYPGREFLYPGCTVHAHELDLKTAGYGYGLMPPRDAARRAHELAQRLGIRSYDLFTTRLLSTQYHRRLLWRQRLVMLREPPLGDDPWDVVFHFRAVDKDGPDKAKNYRFDLADSLVESLARNGCRSCCMGHPDYAYCPPGCEDFRSTDLRRSVAACCSARVAAGENSGPMHLANLCGVPTVIWAAAQWRIDYSLRWNPFSVPIFVAENTTCDPAPEKLEAAIVDALRELRERPVPRVAAGEDVVARRAPYV